MGDPLIEDGWWNIVTVFENVKSPYTISARWAVPVISIINVTTVVVQVHPVRKIGAEKLTTSTASKNISATHHWPGHASSAYTREERCPLRYLIMNQVRFSLFVEIFCRGTCLIRRRNIASSNPFFKQAEGLLSVVG